MSILNNIDEEKLIDLLWMASDDEKLPHDGRNLPSYEVISWKCPQCEIWIDEYSKEEPPPCTVDWRRPLHEKRLREVVSKWKAQNFDENDFLL